MKKTIFSLLLVVATLFIFGCGTNGDKYGKGKNLILTFSTNPSTGFDWEYNFDGDAEITFDREDYKSDVSGDLVGTGGMRTYYFIASKEGTTKLTFTYRRPWEGGEIAYDVVYDLKVDSDLNISCTNKHKGVVESDKELDFFPDPVFEN